MKMHRTEDCPTGENITIKFNGIQDVIKDDELTGFRINLGDYNPVYVNYFKTGEGNNRNIDALATQLGFNEEDYDTADFNTHRGEEITVSIKQNGDFINAYFGLPTQSTAMAAEEIPY